MYHICIAFTENGSINLVEVYRRHHNLGRCTVVGALDIVVAQTLLVLARMHHLSQKENCNKKKLIRFSQVLQFGAIETKTSYCSR